LLGPTSEKRPGTKSREVRLRWSRRLYGDLSLWLRRPAPAAVTVADAA
jgi:hypothetical protein